MKTNTIKYILAYCIPLLMVSCEEKELYSEPKQGTAVETFVASTNFNLSARSQWRLTLDGLEYNARIDGNTLTGTSPTGEAFRFQPEAEKGSVYILFYDPGYGRTRETSTIPPLIEDQSTPEKFMRCDPLRANYSGNVTENLTGITLYHYNALVDFEVTNLPTGTKVFINQEKWQKITPLRNSENPNAYRAIVFPTNKNLTLTVETESETYETLVFSKGLTRLPGIYPEGIGSSSIVTFKARIDENNKLIIEDLDWETWSSEWPLTY